MNEPNPDSFPQPSSNNPQPLWKAGRYKLAAPVSKTGSDPSEPGALPGPSPAMSWMAKAAHPIFSEGGPKLSPAGYGWQAITIKPGEPIMTTIVQFVPKWLRVRLQKPAPQKPTLVNKKKRQLLPTLNPTRSVIFSQDDSPAGYRVLWKL